MYTHIRINIQTFYNYIHIHIQHVLITLFYISKLSTINNAYINKADNSRH